MPADACAKKHFKCLHKHTHDPAWLETFCFLFEILADEWPGERREVQKVVLGDEGWEAGRLLWELGETWTELLARLVCDPYVRLDEGTRSTRRRSFCTICSPMSGTLEYPQGGLSRRGSVGADIAFVADDGNMPWCHGTGFGDFDALASRPNLKWLDLGNTQISDLRPLLGLNNLLSLNLLGTQVTDLSPLAALETATAAFAAHTGQGSAAVGRVYELAMARSGGDAGQQFSAVSGAHEIASALLEGHGRQ